MNAERIDSFHKLMIEAAEKIADCGVFRSCLDCGNFDEPTEICKLVDQRPPARIIVHGCEQHTNLLPF